MLDQSTVRDAVAATMKRVGTYSNLTEKQFDTELKWQLAEVRLTNRGFIFWRGFELGKELIKCLAEAQNWRCCYCGLRTYIPVVNTPAPKSSTLEHVTPLTYGGKDHPDNLVMACHRCNTLRGAQELQSFLRLMNYYRWRWRISHKYDDYPLPK